MVQSFIPEGYVDILEAARMLGIHPQSVRRLIKRGIIPASLLLIGEGESKKWFIKKRDLEKFAANYNPQPGKYGKPWIKSPSSST